MFFGLFGKKEVLCKNCRFAERSVVTPYVSSGTKREHFVSTTGKCLYEKIMYGRHKNPLDGKLYYNYPGPRTNDEEKQQCCKIRNKNFDCKYYDEGRPSLEDIKKYNNEN